ncbi:MAG TPA: hypothetical protein VHK88_12595, partial [Aquihabitans sp.]|nr:hypothetical protein [Aquihabitans sp.]
AADTAERPSGDPAADIAEAPRRSTDGPRWTTRQRLGGFAVATAGILVTITTIVHAGVALYSDDLGISWQLVELPELTADPLGSVWYLHTQPPAHNLVVGSVLRWSPFPPIGTLYVLYLLSLLGIGLLLTDVLARWRLHPVAAGLVSAVALANPNLLSTINVASYEVPVALLLMASIWWFQRQLQHPGLVPLVGLAASLTLLTMTRSLFHPAFAVAVVVLAAVARRAPWRHVAVALAIPVVVVGGWMVKNQVLFGTPTLSSWLGFNMQRGVTAPMARTDVERDVRTGEVTPLALELPWGELDSYGRRVDGCRPEHDHPSVTSETKYVVRDIPIPNFNHECYLPLYEESQENALTLVRRHPGRYLSTRLTVLTGSFTMASIGLDAGLGSSTKRLSERTWMDAVADRALLPVTREIDMSGWNLPLFGEAPLPFQVSLTLALLAAGVLLRGALATVRLARVGWATRATSWTDGELLWALVAAAVGLVIIGGDLLEFGENGRFRALVDPLLVAVPLAGLCRVVASLAAGARRGARPVAAGQPTA